MYRMPALEVLKGQVVSMRDTFTTLKTKLGCTKPLTEG